MTDPRRPMDFARAVDAAAGRKLHARRRQQRSVLSGLGVAGLVGWSVVIPTVLGAGLGRWLDQRNPGGRSFTLALLVAGLCLGCMNAWHWIAREAAQTVLDEDSATDAIHDEHKAVPRDR